jgi:translocation and assembly module TamB
LKRLMLTLASLAAFLVIVSGVVLAVILLTTPGLRWTLAAATALSDGAVSVGRAEGRLVGPMRLYAVAVEAGGTAVRIESAALDWSPAELWRTRTLDVASLQVAGVGITLGAGGNGGGPPVIDLPLGVRLRDARVRGIHVETADGAAVDIEEVVLAGRLDEDALTLDRLQVRAPRGDVDAEGTVAVSGAGESRLSVRWSTTFRERVFEGAGDLSGDAARLRFRQHLEAPAAADVEGEVEDPFGEPRWTARAGFQGLDAGIADPRAAGVTLTGTVDAAGGPQRLRLDVRSEVRDPELGPWDVTATAEHSDGVWRVPDFALLQRDGAGRMEGRAQAAPANGGFRISVELRGADIDVAGSSAARIEADVDVGTDPKLPWTLDVTVADLALSGAPPISVRAVGSGTASAHALVLDLERKPNALHLAARGGLEDGVWSGSIADGAVSLAGETRLRQDGVAQVRAEAGSARVSGWCWEGPGTRACAGAQWRRGGESEAAVDLERLDLSDVPEDLLPGGLAIDGVVSGRAAVALRGSALERADAALQAPRVALRHTDIDGATTVTALRGVTLDAETREDGLSVTAAAGIDPSGRVRASLRLPGWTPEVEPARQRIDGEVELSVEDVRQLAALIPVLSQPEGSVQGRIEIAGTLAEPALRGRAELRGGAALVPRAGIAVRDASLELAGDDTGRLSITGGARSGDGQIVVDGSASVQSLRDWSVVLRVTGKDFETLKHPDVLLVASPDLEISAAPGRIEIRGAVDVPRADVRLSAPKGSIEASPDVVIVGEREQPVARRLWQIHTRVTLRLGDAVAVHGYGFEGRVTGDLTLIEQAGRATVAEGELRAVDAAYSVYGQMLDIEIGRLVFAGGPVDDPAIDARAVRVVREVTAGVQVSGRLKRPELSLFSEPALPDGDILSYLMVGRPMAEASSAQAQVLMRVAASLGGKSGPGLVSRIAQTFGLSELSLTRGPEDRETAIQLGRFLSPRLYLTYMIGLWEHGSAVQLRYTLTDWLTLETMTGTRSSVDLLYSIER